MKTTNRFYPEFYPSFSHEPTKDRFSIIQTPEKGEGIITLKNFSKDDIVFRFMGVLSEEITLFSLQLNHGHHIHDPFVMGKVLHCCEPNMQCDMSSQTFYAARPIKKGEFLTMDYETTEDQLFRSFSCSCGAQNCRGFISGKNFRIPAIDKSYQKVINL